MPVKQGDWSRGYLIAVKTPLSLMTESSLMFQLLVDCLFKHFIAVRTDNLDCATTQHSTREESLRITLREQKFFTRSEILDLRRNKREIFVQILSAMEASDHAAFWCSVH